MNNPISETIKSIAEFKDLQKKLKEDCKKICADETISIQDRWELFKNAPDKEHSSYDETPPSQLVGLEKEISPYDDWYQLTFCGFAMAGLRITKLQIITKDE